MTPPTPVPSFDLYIDDGRVRAPKLKPAPFFLLKGDHCTDADDDYDILCRANTRLVLQTVSSRVVRRRLAGWVYRFMPRMLRELARHGGATKRLTGRSIAGQAADMIRMANRTGLSPAEYYEFGLFRFNGSAELGNFIPLRFYYFVALACGLARRGRFEQAPDFKDKSVFESHCAALGEPCVRTVAIIGNDRAYGGDGTADFERFPDLDLFVKPKRGGQGRNTMRFQSLGNGAFRGSDGIVLQGEALLAHLLEKAKEARRSLLVQIALRNDPFIEKLAGKALATTRIITIRDEKDEPEVVYACFRTAGSAESIVDNYHAKGVAFMLDIHSGVLGSGRRLSFTEDPAFHDFHPVTGSRMNGTSLPKWSEARALALRLHRASPHLLVCGWDIAFAEDGPTVIEANLPPGTPVVQMQRGFLGTRYAQLMAMHARNWLEAEDAYNKS